jgi:hypothetical protein
MDNERSTSEAPAPHRTTLARRARRKPPKPKRGRRTPRLAANELIVERRRVQVTTLRVGGYSIREIAAAIKCSLATVHSDLEAVLLRTYDESEDRMRRERELSLLRLDVGTKGLWPKVKRGDAEAIRALVRLEERRAKLEGHDAQQGSRLELTGAGGGPIEVAEAKNGLQRKLDELKGRLHSVPSASVPPAAAS